MLDQIFLPGWESNLLLYSFVFLMAEYAVYRIIYPAIVGTPKTYDQEGLRSWRRKASWWSAVIFAPIYEELLFTYLAFASFLSFARAGQEGAVMLIIAGIFALLHLPGDWRGSNQKLDLRNLWRLFRFQMDRFFYMLAAYIIYDMTGLLWLTIIIHYFFNFTVSSCIFEWEDQPESFEDTDGRLLLLQLLDLIFAGIACVYFYTHFPTLWPLVLLSSSLMFLNFFWGRYIIRKRQRELYRIFPPPDKI